MTPRRFYVRKRFASRLTRDGLEAVWLARQLEEPGTPLAASLPHRSRLIAAGYLAVEDLEGVTIRELQQAGLTRQEAAAVIAALV